MVIESLPRDKMMEQIKFTLEMASDGSHEDLKKYLQNYLVLTEKYTEEAGIKVIFNHTGFDGLLLPYLRIYSQKDLLGLDFFGTKTSVFDIYKFLEMTDYISEYVISTIPVKNYQNGLVLFCIPLMRYYSMLMTFEQIRYSAKKRIAEINGQWVEERGI